MAFWIFKCNPDKYRLADRLRDPNDAITWTVNQQKDKIREGHTAFLWTTGKDRGIRAVLRLDTDPQEQPEQESEQKYWAERDTETKLRVRCTITERHVELRHDLLRTVPGLENLSMFHGVQMGTNFPVTPEEGRLILDLARRRSSSASGK